VFNEFVEIPLTSQRTYSRQDVLNLWAVIQLEGRSVAQESCVQVVALRPGKFKGDIPQKND